MTARRQAILALDQGTTSSRALVFASDGSPLAGAHRAVTQSYPQPGWVEQDPEEIWRGQLEAALEALEQAGMTAADLTAVGVTNQRETVLLWDARTGEPVGNALGWQCRRTSDRCEELRLQGCDDYVRETTGLRLDPYFSASKLEWLLAQREEARSLLRQGRLRAGTIDSFLVWRLTGGREHLTDYSNASRTMLFGLDSLDWEPALLKLFAIPREILPRPAPSAGLLARTGPSVLGAAVPITGVAGDQQAALFGQGCFSPGQVKNTYGTGCFVLMNLGDRVLRSQHDLVTTVAWGLGPGRGQVSYALEGSVFVAGAAVQWLRDELDVIGEAGQVGPLAATVEDTGGVFFVPALTGLGAPFWDPTARGLLIGLTRGTTRAHLARATEEAICYQTRAVLEAMGKDTGLTPPALTVDGGATGDDFLLQLQADVLDLPVVRQTMQEATAFGAAALAGIGVGLWSLADVARMTGANRVFEPAAERAWADASYQKWLQAVERARGWAG